MKNFKGMTIVELVTVIAAIALIATVALAIARAAINKSNGKVIYDVFQQLILAEDAHKDALGAYEQATLADLCPEYGSLLEMCGASDDGTSLKPFGATLDVLATNPASAASVATSVGWGAEMNNCPEDVCAAVAAKLNNIRFVTASYSDENLYMTYDNGSGS